MWRSFRRLVGVVVVVALAATLAPGADERDWTHVVRIAAYPLGADNAAAIVRDAARSHVYGIEVDNDIPADTRASSIRPRN